MTIIEDTRNPIAKHANVHKYANENEIIIIRSKLLCGDYTLPTDQSVCIDTKAGMQEVYQNLAQGHTRFRKECILAMETGIKLIVLIEQSNISDVDGVETWKNPRIHSWEFLNNAHAHGKMLDRRIPPKPPIPSDRLANIMRAMTRNYGVEWRFCDKRDTGRIIVEILGWVA